MIPQGLVKIGQNFHAMTQRLILPALTNSSCLQRVIMFWILRKVLIVEA